MLPQTHLHQFILPRINRAVLRLRGMIWQYDSVQLRVARAESRRIHRPYTEACQETFTPVASHPHFWGRKFEQTWWRIELPEAHPNSPRRYLRWRDQGEATLYIDGVPWHGIDPGHQIVPLPEGAKGTAWIESVCVRTGIWVTGEVQGLSEYGSQFDGVTLATRNDLAWEVYFDFAVLLELLALEYRKVHPEGRGLEGYGYLPPIEKVPPLVRKLFARLDEAVTVLDARGLKAVRPLLKQIYADFPADAAELDCILTGHAHIDLVWLWPESVGEFKAVHTFATALRIMDEYPEFRFGYSQPASYAAVGRRSPPLMDRVKARIRDGHWEATGGMEVESDIQIPCGEALVRSVLLGQEGFRELRGDNGSLVGWLPDVFGYPSCVVQIFKAAGIEWFFTTKMHYSNVTRFPYTSFRWRAPDGSEMLAHIQATMHYNGEVVLRDLRDIAANHRQAAVHGEFLCPTGYGDGGGGVNAEMCERARRAANLLGVPRTRWDRIEDFYARLEPLRDQLPVWDGEIYLEYHRGVQTTHARLKTEYRRAERALQVWEAAHAVLGRGPVDEARWRRLIFAQFHDYVTGSSVQEVYDEGVPELAALASEVEAAARVALQDAEKGTACLFNPHPYSRLAQTESGMVELPPLAGVELAAVQPAMLPPVTGDVTRLENGRVRAELTSDGRLAALSVDGRPVALTAPGNQLYTFPDHPHGSEAWDIDRPTLTHSQPARCLGPGRVEQSDTAGLVVAFDYALAEQSRVTVRYSLRRGSTVLDIAYDVDWQDVTTLLKTSFATGYRGASARYGQPFGSVLRSQKPGRPADEAMFEAPASRWAVVADDTEEDGLFLVSEAKYGFGCQSGLLHLSLVRSAYVTDAVLDKGLRSHEGNRDYSDIGRHEIRIAVGAFTARLKREEQPAALADLLFTAPVAYTGRPVASPFLGLEGGDSLHPCWVRPLADGTIVVRLHEVFGRRGQTHVRLAPGWRAVPVDLNEKAVAEPVSGPLSFGPYQLISLRLERC